MRCDVGKETTGTGGRWRTWKGECRRNRNGQEDNVVATATASSTDSMWGCGGGGVSGLASCCSSLLLALAGSGRNGGRGSEEARRGEVSDK